MKIYLLILTFLFFACSTSKQKIPENILSETAFGNILKEIHLAEATFELNKNNGIENANNELANTYFDIYKKNQISEADFTAMLNYYSAELEQIYTDILNQLNKENSSIDQQ
jgi:hypothetical protein